MIVEVVGSTSAGKSSVARRLLELLNARGCRAFLLADGWRWSSDEAARKYHRLPLGYLRWPVAVSVAMDALACPWFIVFAFQRPGLTWFMAKIVWRDTKRAGLKLNAFRNIAKHMGNRELLARRSAGDDIVILDEGAVHQAHNLFVHPDAAPRRCEVRRFIAEIPLPDLLVLVEGPRAAIVQRTMRRRHVRVRGANAAQTEHYVAHAEQVFRSVCELAGLRTETVVVRNPADAQSLDGALESVLSRISHAVGG